MHRSLLDVGLVKEVVKVERRYMPTTHRPVPVYLLHGAPPEAAHEAMRRYAELPRKGSAHTGPTQATIDEAIAAIKLITPELKGTLKELMPILSTKGITYPAARIAVQRLNNQEAGEIWA